MYIRIMDDTQKMFRAIINGQSALKQELLVEIRKVDEKVDKVSQDLVGLEKRLTKRIDKIGLQVARLEDDAPTREEHDALEERVVRIEQRISVSVA